MVGVFATIVTLLYTWKVTRWLLGTDRSALDATVAVASLPQLQYLSGSLNHDALAAAAASVFLFHATRLARGSPLDAAWKAGDIARAHQVINDA